MSSERDEVDGNSVHPRAHYNANDKLALERPSQYMYVPDDLDACLHGNWRVSEYFGSANLATMLRCKAISVWLTYI